MPWRSTLNRIRERKLELARIDPQGGMPLLPPSGATKSDIASVERKLKRAIPPSYAAFLAQHDGFPEIVFGTSLLGAQPLMRGTFDRLAHFVIELGDANASEEASESATGIARQALSAEPLQAPTSPLLARTRVPRWSSPIVPFAVDAGGETFFAWDTREELAHGELAVIVWTNDIGVRVEGFPALLEFIVDLIDADIDARDAVSVRRPTRSAALRARAESGERTTLPDAPQSKGKTRAA